MTGPATALDVPATVDPRQRALLEEVAERNAADHGADLLGLVLSGSVGRGVPTEHSDLDVFVVLTEDGVRGRRTHRSPELDEVPVSLVELEQVPAFGSADWWFRWSYAWAPVLLDRTDGRLAAALQRQASVTECEAEDILVRHDRLDGWLNYAYRALKNHRDGRVLESRLDAAESIPWLLDVLFTLAGRVRPYHKYLPWELREHPLDDWDAEGLLGLLEATLNGDPEALRRAFGRVEALCAAYDERRGEPRLTAVIADWDDELGLLRG